MKYIDKKVEDVKIAYIGGGSRGWAWGLMSDLVACEDMSGKVELYDIDYDAALQNEIIGNIPVTDHEDYPILYGQHSGMYPGVWYECGKTMLCREDLRYQGMEFINNGISYRLDVKLDILRECIAVGSNMPYWEKTKFISEDLRNPKYRKELAKIKKQFGL